MKKAENSDTNCVAIFQKQLFSEIYTGYQFNMMKQTRKQYKFVEIGIDTINFTGKTLHFHTFFQGF